MRPRVVDDVDDHALGDAVRRQDAARRDVERVDRAVRADREPGERHRLAAGRVRDGEQAIGPRLENRVQVHGEAAFAPAAEPLVEHRTKVGDQIRGQRPDRHRDTGVARTVHRLAYVAHPPGRETELVDVQHRFVADVQAVHPVPPPQRRHVVARAEHGRSPPVPRTQVEVRPDRAGGAVDRADRIAADQRRTEQHAVAEGGSAVRAEHVRLVGAGCERRETVGVTARPRAR